jgi:hypothetical protein
MWKPPKSTFWPPGQERSEKVKKSSSSILLQITPKPHPILHHVMAMPNIVEWSVKSCWIVSYRPWNGNTKMSPHVMESQLDRITWHDGTTPCRILQRHTTPWHVIPYHDSTEYHEMARNRDMSKKVKMSCRNLAYHTMSCHVVGNETKQNKTGQELNIK